MAVVVADREMLEVVDRKVQVAAAAAVFVAVQSACQGAMLLRLQLEPVELVDLQLMMTALQAEIQ